MAYRDLIQKQFVKFDSAISFDFHGEENSKLRERRDAVVQKLRSKLAERFGASAPTFAPRNQGSYAMRTGIKPLGDNDYDIDVAVIFNLSVEDHPDPVQVKEWVLEALQDHTVRGAQMMRPCVRVEYQEGGELAYHLDLAVYSSGDANRDGQTYLAKGYSGSSDDKREWYPADPMALLNELKQGREGDELAQFRRVNRYLKRWKDYNFSSSGEAAPRGIAITSCAHRWFSASKDWSGADDDLAAAANLVNSMLHHFGRRLEVPLPVPPYDDPFQRMSDRQMEGMQAKLEVLARALRDAAQEEDPVTACEILKGVFGDDFPIPDPGAAGKKAGKAVLSSSSSA